MLQKTKIGWVVAGRCSNEPSATLQCNIAREHTLEDANLTRLWEIEEVSSTVPRVKGSSYLENHFKKHTRRNAEGRFIVTLPTFNLESLGNSYDIAVKRFLNLERSLSRDSNRRLKYNDFMNEYIRLGHMSLSPPIISNKPHYVIPHHAVQTENSDTSKFRIVFDGSAKTLSGKSLNDCQMVGPPLQDDLSSILLRFRKHEYVMTTDVEKMYRQVLVEPSQRCLQLIIWREEPSRPLEIYELNTLTYGTASASFLAIRSLHELAEDYKTVNPQVASRILKDFYVDDGLSGADTLTGAQELCCGMDAALRAGCFNLRKWLSNDQRVLNGVGQNNACAVDFGKNANSKVLGLLWDPELDAFHFRICADKHGDRITKRSILSEVAQIFDPLGLLAPSVIKAKIILQTIWSAKLDWDESVPTTIHTEWRSLCQALNNLNLLRMSRHVVCSKAVRVDLHGFADASERAYGACVYMRSVDEHGNVMCKVLTAKTRVAPLKRLTIPRLELCAALLLSRLVHKIKSSMECTFNSLNLWTDSTIVLCWLRKPCGTLKQFVSNRIDEIQTLSEDATWRHVPTADNPADMLSRGICPSELLHSALWWNGPKWLVQAESCWPQSSFNFNAIDLPELRAQNCALVEFDSAEPLLKFENYSSLREIETIVSYVIRFINNCRKQVLKRQFGTITAIERNHSLSIVIKSIQKSAFGIEFDSLRKQGTVSSKSTLLALAPFLDENQIIRVGGRLANSNLVYNRKHPILLPKSNHISDLIFREAHEKWFHIGPLGLLNLIRSNYWPLNGRNTARKIVHKCIRCFRAKPEFVSPLMGQLPAARVSPSHPFSHCGTDYAGPFALKSSHLRGCRTYKAWIVLFVCLSTKAVHLDLVTNLTAQGFVATLRRFASRRGRPVHLYSDNATNYVGANKELREIHAYVARNSEELRAAVDGEAIRWHFIPPRSPHFGGICEAGVKSVKYHLKRITNSQIFTYEEMYTLCAQIEAILNSRPLTTLSSSPNDLAPLTPAHLLHGRPLHIVEDHDYSFTPVSRLTRYQHVQWMAQQFWKRWRTEYLNEMQQRTKWMTNVRIDSIKLGTICLIADDAMPSMHWRLGRIIQIHKGKDTIPRAVTLQTQGGTLQRAVRKICPLPIDEQFKMPEIADEGNETAPEEDNSGHTENETAQTDEEAAHIDINPEDPEDQRRRTA